MEKPILKLYKYENNTFVLKAIIDDFMECSFERNLYQAGSFTISINYNIPNAQLFQRGLFVQFGSDPYDFGEIISISDAIGSDGKGSQLRTITGYDSRYIFKRRVIKNMNSNGLWVMTGKGEIVLRSLISDQCGSSAEVKRRLPVSNTIPSTADAIGKEYSVSEQFSNLYEVCKTIATQSEIGWRLRFNGSNLILECYEGENRAQTVQFSTSFDSLANGQFTDSSDSYTNAIYVGGKGQNDDRDIYEGEDGAPEGLDRYESWDNQSNMTTEDEYEAEALSMLTQYGQTVTVSGNGLAKSPYIYKEEYNVGDIITLAFSGKSAAVQILSVTEHWAFGQYSINFSFGKPQNNIQDQLQLILRKIQTASEKSESTDSVRWYTIPTDTEMPKADVTYRTIGFIGNVGSGATFKLYLDNEKTGAKTYHIYFKQLAGAGKLTLTTGVTGASNLVLNSGTYVAIVYVDENGNISSQGMTATNAVEAGNTQPATSDGVNSAINGAVSGLSVPSVGGNGKYLSAISETDGKISATVGDIDSVVTANSNNLITSGGVAGALLDKENFINMGELNKATLDDLLLYIYQIIDKSSITGTGVWIGHSIFKFSTFWSGSGVEMLINLENDGYYRVLFINGSIYYKERITTTADIVNAVESDNMNSVTSNAVAGAIQNANYVMNIGDDNDPDNFPADAMRIYRTRNYNIGWGSNDGFIINIPWSNTYGCQIALDDESNFIAVRTRQNGSWTSWERVVLASDLKRNELVRAENGTGNIKYYKASYILPIDHEITYIMQSRAGELIIISCGYEDNNAAPSTPKARRILNTYSKIAGLAWASPSQNLYFCLNGYSHQTVLTKIAGDIVGDTVLEEITQAEYNSATPITIET
ncbi:MAG: siphovirus ReqiPepy6 Gp37-like family protein [Alphaproteobacteria bacterium]|nr:siphovirus ReqiPepy6 Gp37-like family protein [Alphaproteobacteria bacterium]